MKIDLSEWNEYIADDVPPGSPPCGVKLETMQILTANSYTEKPTEDYLKCLEVDSKSFQIRFFWRIKK